MAKNEQKEELMVRLVIDPNDDKKLYESFSKIKAYMGARINTAVARFCIQRTYDQLKKEGKVD